MSTTTRSVSATPEQVWEVLADGWLYPLFVVGASRMRDVDDSWPAVGAKLHHSVGTRSPGPAVASSTIVTTVVSPSGCSEMSMWA